MTVFAMVYENAQNSKSAFVEREGVIAAFVILRSGEAEAASEAWRDEESRF